MKRMHGSVGSVGRIFLIILLCCGFPLTGSVGAAENDAVAAAAETIPAKIDINRAGPAELISLPGIGAKMAERITTYREQHGPFGSLEELLEVKGIGPKVLERLKPLLIVS